LLEVVHQTIEFYLLMSINMSTSCGRRDTHTGTAEEDTCGCPSEIWLTGAVAEAEPAEEVTFMTAMPKLPE